MPGYNHYSDCGCGWCVKDSGAVVHAGSWYLPPKFDTFESYTIPNARCPVCGDSVFFYQSLYGGRVFFDSLGPPWPKHPCTIQQTSGVGRCLVPQSVPPSKPEWERSGWRPLIITRVHLEGQWWVVSAKIAETGEAIRLLVHGEPTLGVGAPAAFSGWNSKGEAMFTYLENRMQVVSASVIAYKYADHFQADPALLALRRAEQLHGVSR